MHQDYIKELMISTHVGFQTTRLSKTLLAHIALVRFLVRVNTHVPFQMTRFTKSFIAHDWRAPVRNDDDDDDDDDDDE